MKLRLCRAKQQQIQAGSKVKVLVIFKYGWDYRLWFLFRRFQCSGWDWHSNEECKLIHLKFLMIIIIHTFDFNSMHYPHLIWTISIFHIQNSHHICTLSWLVFGKPATFWGQWRSSLLLKCHAIRSSYLQSWIKAIGPRSHFLNEPMCVIFFFKVIA